MEKQAHKKFCWIIKNFSPQSERLYSVPVLIGDCKWRPIAYPIRDKYFSLCLQVVDFESLPCGWGRYVELRLTLRNQHNSLNLSIKADHCFDEKRTTWGIPIPERIPICKLQTELYQSEHVVKGDFKIIAEVDVFEAVGTLTESDISGKASELLTKKIRNDGNESGDLLKKTSPEKESNHVNESKPVRKLRNFVVLYKRHAAMCSVLQEPICLLGIFHYTNGEASWAEVRVGVFLLNMTLCLPDSQLFPSEVVKARLTIVNQLSEKLSISKESEHCFDEQNPTLGYTFPYELLVEDGGFLVNEDLMIIVEVIGASDVFEDSSTQGKVDVNGFQVLPSQVEYVRSIFERHPDIAVEFRAKNQHLRTSCMIFLLSLIETLCQSLEELSNEDLVEADIALTYVKDAGFKVDWLEKKLDQVKEKKEKELSDMVQLQEMEDHLLKLKQSCSDLDDLVVKKKDELSVTRSPLSFDDVDWLEKKLDQVKDKKEREQSGLARLHELEEYLLKLKQKCSNLDLLVEKENVELSATRTPMSFNDVV
ncbi:MATH/TRAF domain [Arabidopsis thaliana x Arabidopsis arenosa]|uniref:MATH domain-containing protein n=2 Tax=Arabidopsis TaxID=3701 RepID=A0A178VI60_ARATH|nr:MATH/TRAF domain [Arabidopsis thaliana x Arabidopsis arenosa]OAP05418.1 hypothetical protein AXX17_AT3G52970 [Arabidopsis thaliana]